MNNSIAVLKEIIKYDTMLINSINNIEPATFKSVRIFYNKTIVLSIKKGG